MEWPGVPLKYEFILFLDQYELLCLHVAEAVILFSVAFKPRFTVLWSCGESDFEGSWCDFYVLGGSGKGSKVWNDQ